MGVIAGVIVAIVFFIEGGDLDWASLVVVSGVSGVVVFAVLHPVLRTLLLFRYRDIWKTGIATGALGVRGEIIAEIEHGKPSVEGLQLSFSNRDYAQMFMKANNLLESRVG